MRMLPNQTSFLGMIGGVVMDRSPTFCSLDSQLLLAPNCQAQARLIILDGPLVNYTWNWLVSLVALTITRLLLYAKSFPISCVPPIRFKTTLLVGELVSTNYARLDILSTMRTPSGSLSTTYRLVLRTISFDNRPFISYQLQSRLVAATFII